jgi:hypothetical protein
LFQASFPSATNIKLANIKSPIAVGEKLVFSGNLTDADGNPIPASRGVPRVGLTWLDPSTSQWTPLQIVTVSLGGSFNGTWIPSNAGTYVVRAEYQGIQGVYAGSTSPVQQLNVTANIAALKLSASQSRVTAGQTITLTWSMTPFVRDANITLSYATDNRTYKPIGIFPMSSPTMSYSWTAPVSGQFTIMASWTGNESYGPANAVIVMNKT